MVKIITTVGTSIFINFLKTNNLIKNAYNTLNDIPLSENSKYQNEIKNLKTNLENIFQNNSNACAETQTIVKIKEKYSYINEFKIILITTDTILSHTAAEIIRENFKSDRINDINIITVKGLQIKNFDNFKKEGFDNLVSCITNIIKGTNSKEDKIVFNISGGYKAIIPILTILGQLYNIPLYYIYEDSSELIEISKLPINYDLSFAEQIFPLLILIDKQNKAENRYSPRNDSEKNVIENLLELGILENLNNSYWITPIGNLFMDYISKRGWESPNALGIFMEFKLYEYFSNQNLFNKVSRGVSIVNFNNNNDTSDIDIKLDSGIGYIWVECKSFTQLLLSAYNIGGKIIQQIERQFNIIKSNINAKEINSEYLKIFPIEYHLYIYKENYENFDEEMIKYLINIDKTMMETNNIIFKVFYFETNIQFVPDEKDERDKHYKNPYYKILSKPILSENITELNLNKEN